MKLYGKKDALQRLEKFTASGRIPHALMITGADGAGKRTLADYIAMLMLCGNEKAPCMGCNECLRISEHIHPDVVYPFREMKNGKYTAPELRDYMLGCYKLPNDSQIRVYIFEQAETMNDHCQNALLKIIEEPLSFNRYIFIVSDKSFILETILSRVTEIPAGMPSAEECAAALVNYGIDPVEAEKLSQTFSGNIGRCLAAHSSEGEAELLKLSGGIASDICRGREYDCMAKLCGIKNRDDMTVVLRSLSDIFGNAAVLAAGGKPYGFSPSVSSEIAEGNSIKKINAVYEVIGELLRSLDFNPNVQLTAARCCAAVFSAVEEQ